MAPRVGRPRKSATSSSSPPTHPSRPSLHDSIVSPTEEVKDTKPAISQKLSFQGVVIPSRARDEDIKMRPNSTSDSRRASNSTSSLSTISSASPFTGTNSDAETPETSTISTPAESISTSKRLYPKGHVFENPFAAQGKGKGKRKRASTAIDGDAALAQALQEEEYGIDISKHIHPSSKKRRRTIALDSDDDDDQSIKTDHLEEVPLTRTLEPSKKTMKAPARPRRKAAKSASKALKNAAGTILDSEEDSSDLSDFVNDDDDALSKVSGVRHFAGVSEDESDALSSNDEAGAGFEDNLEDGETMQSNWERQKKKSRAQRERAKLEQAHPEINTMWDELDAVPLITTEEAPQPACISRKLKSFQLEGLNWMIKQEQTKWKGGLLGDEMGMGKTIQAVSLIMSDYPTKPHQPTLVVVPPVALMQWTNEINDYTSGQLKVLLYHGQNAKAKQMSVKELEKYDVIMISYSGLESIYRKQERGWTRKEKIVKETSAIHEIDFHRLILDEAHSIKSRTAGVAKACFALKSTYKWCLSGTPVQNRIGEFFSLLRFLGVTPFANYFCKQCPCARIDWRTTPDYRCTGCKHRTLDHVSVFNQEILNPIVAGESDEQRKLGLKKLRMLTDHIMLRRMKRDQTASMELPPKEVVIHNEFFGEIERDFSSSIMSNTARTFDTYVSRGVMLNNYANIFGLIMQMRQVSDHPDLLLKKHSEAGQNVLICNICDEPAEEAIRSRCKHDFCRVCAKDYVKTCEASGATPDCPRCHISLSIDFDQPDLEQDSESVKKSSIINRIKMENWTSSTKIEMLVYDLYKLRSKKTTLKSIVFSQFTSMLQLIEWRLRRAGFNTVMLDGSMTPQQRQKSIEYFMNNTDVEVFLVSLKAGGVALNLTEASRVFIVDPWWNPAAEWQSADRCHRIGQRRPCVITRLCIEDSVESRIVMLQEKKANLIQGTVNNDEVAMDKLTPEDMQFLFRGS